MAPRVPPRVMEPSCRSAADRSVGQFRSLGEFLVSEEVPGGMRGGMRRGHARMVCDRSLPAPRPSPCAACRPCWPHGPLPFATSVMLPASCPLCLVPPLPRAPSASCPLCCYLSRDPCFPRQGRLNTSRRTTILIIRSGWSCLARLLVCLPSRLLAPVVPCRRVCHLMAMCMPWPMGVLREMRR